MNRKRVVKVLFAAAFLGATGIFYSCSEKTGTEVMVLETQTPLPATSYEVTATPSATVVSNKKLYVYICGQVKKPEVYEVDPGARIRDLVNLAGGFTKEAAPECVNLARVVEDGEQIYIPSVTERKQGEYSHQQDTKKEKTTDVTESKEKVNINVAGLEELMTLPGIGETKAAAIIAYREEHGAFSSTEELMNITGIKTGLYTKIKDYVKVN